MESVYDFVVTPNGERYNNTKKIGDKELILNTEVYNHQYVNREAKVLSVPRIGEYGIQAGDVVITHHNVFRRWHDMHGVERNSRSYFDDDTYFIGIDQVFLYRRDKEWLSPKGYCFIQPIKAIDKFNEENERPLIGIVKYSDGTVEEGSLVGFSPGDEYEFVVDGVRMYRVMSKFITNEYEYQGDEEKYNPSWAKSC